MRMLIAFLSFVVLTLTFPGIAASTDWPQFHFSVDRSGFNPEETTISGANVANLQVIWNATFDANITAPVIADRRVYVGSNDGNLYALDGANGAILWTGATGASIVFTPGVDGGRVFVGSDDSKVYAFPVSCSSPCTPLWTATTNGRISSSPAIADGIVYIGAGRGADGDLWAFDAATGATRWVAPLPAAPRTPAVANGVVYTTANALYAFPASCSTPCSPLWVAPDAAAQPAVANDIVYVDAGFVNRFHAFPASCATPCLPLWTAFTASSATTAPAIANGLVFNAEFNGVVQAFPTSCATPCSPLWTVNTGGPQSAQNFDSSAAIANGLVYVGVAVTNEPGKLVVLNATTGEIRAAFSTGGLPSSPAVVDGSVYIAANTFFAGALTRLGFPAPPVLPVTVDIKPGAFPNTMNPQSNGVIPVAILTTDAFDATTVDPLSVRFGPRQATEAHGRGHIADVNGDGRLDLVLHFRTDQTGIACGDTSVSLTGLSVAGALIEGTDSIVTVGCK